MITIDKIKVDAQAIASQGNAMLGIRDSGKTYSATMLAEKFYANGIPFVAFDPIGVWRFLRVPGKGPGIPVVVAGGAEPDLPLTVAGAPEIVRAAMANGVSLVIDLFDIELSKADWKRIVTSCVRVLLHENAKHGLRHVFIEEAAEFAPQRVGPDQGAVYAEIEKLARMGGNSRLGYTLINQRAEEVNKAVLELCDNLFLHRQKGRNSLNAISKWLDIGNVAEHKAITASLSTLPTGEAWAWLQGSEIPIRARMPAKNSFHPDRRVMRGDSELPRKAAVDVGGFVAKMRGTLGAIAKEASTVEELRAELAKLRRAKPEPDGVPEAEVARRVQAAAASVPPWLAQAFEAFRKTIATAGSQIEEIAARALERDSPEKTAQAAAAAAWRPGPAYIEPTLESKIPRVLNPRSASEPVSRPQQRILDAVARLNAFGLAHPSRLMVAAFADVSPRSSGFEKNVSTLRTAGLIDFPAGGLLELTVAGAERIAEPFNGGRLTVEDLQEAFLRVVSGPQAAILRALIGLFPRPVSREDLAERVEPPVSAASSGFEKNLSTLRTLGALDYPVRGQVRAADFLFGK